MPIVSNMLRDEIERLQTLAGFRFDSQSELDLVLDKLLDVTLSQHRQRLARYQGDLREFEARYGMDSATFYQRFEAGEIGDDMDYFEWSGLWELSQDLETKIARLEQAV